MQTLHKMLYNALIYQKVWFSKGVKEKTAKSESSLSHRTLWNICKDSQTPHHSQDVLPFSCRIFRHQSQVSREQRSSGRNLLVHLSFTQFSSTLWQLLCVTFMIFQSLGKLKLFDQFHFSSFLLCKYHLLHNRVSYSGGQGWHTGESSCLLPMCPRFNSSVVSCELSWFSSFLQGFFSRFSVFLPSLNTNISNSNLTENLHENH